MGKEDVDFEGIKLRRIPSCGVLFSPSFALFLSVYFAYQYKLQYNSNFTGLRSNSTRGQEVKNKKRLYIPSKTSAGLHISLRIDTD